LHEGARGRVNALSWMAVRSPIRTGIPKTAITVSVSTTNGSTFLTTDAPIKSWMGATHFQMKTLKHVGTEMVLHVLAYNMKRVMHILGVGGLVDAIRA
jgi:hypothetical protein